MAVDEVFLDLVSLPDAPRLTYLRFYTWKQPTLSIGYSQNAEKVVDLRFCQNNGIDVVRRPTGGKAVLHDQELTYSIVSNDPTHFPIHDISKTYERIAAALSLGLLQMGVQTALAPARPNAVASTQKRGFPQKACFAASQHHEILWNGRKLIGSAQRRNRNSFLQHGSILIGFDSSLLAKALASPGLVGLDSDVATLTECLGHKPHTQELLQNLVDGFSRCFNVSTKILMIDEELRLEIERKSLKRKNLVCGNGGKTA
ncbi:MAG: lipoate--protein ligase family protein [Terriglobia bacterium]